MAIEQLHTYCAMCISRCGVVATVEDGRLTKVSADPAHPNGCICVKGTAAPEIVYSPDRLRSPMKRTRPKGDSDPGWATISWDEAMELTASRLRDIKIKYGPEAVVFARATPAGSATADFEPWLQRLANAFGSPNVMTPTHICNWHRAYGSQYTYGVATPPPDYDNARCILLWGFNPHASWPAAASRISRAKAAGAKLIVIDPRKSAVAEKADLWLRVGPGGDGALAMSMIHVLLEEKLYDENFVRDWTNGAFLLRQDNHQLLTARDLSPSGDGETFFVWDDRANGLAPYRADRGYARSDVVPALFGAHEIALAGGKVVECRPAFDQLTVLAAQFAPEQSEEITWASARDVRQAVGMFAKEKPSCHFSWAGLEQHGNATQTNRAMCLFYALTGQYDCRGSNVVFSTTPTHPIAGREVLSKDQASRRLGYAERPMGPTADSRLRAILRGISSYPDGAALCGQGPRHIRGRHSSRQWGSAARQGCARGSGFLCPRGHVCQP